MRTSGRRRSALLIGAVVALSACERANEPADLAPSTSSRAAAPALPVVSPGTTQGVPVAKVDRPRWTSAETRVGQVLDAPIVDGTVILAGSQGIAAVTAATGRVQWAHIGDRLPLPGTTSSYYSSYSMHGPIAVSEPVEDLGRLVVVGYGSRGFRDGVGLVALSVRTGRVVWQKRLGDNRSDLPRLGVVGASATRVLLAVGPSRFSSPTRPSGPRALALDTATGKTVWQRNRSVAGRLSGDVAVVVDLDQARVSASPTTTIGTVVGLDARTARERWRLAGARHDAVDIGAPTDRTVVVDRSPGRLVDTRTGRVLWTSKDDPTCVSDDDRLVVCASEDHLISWSVADPVVRSSARTVEDSPRLLEDGRVHLNSTPTKVVDLSGSPRLTSLRTTVVAGGSGFLVLDGADGTVAVAPVSNGI